MIYSICGKKLLRQYVRSYICLSQICLSEIGMFEYILSAFSLLGVLTGIYGIYTFKKKLEDFEFIASTMEQIVQEIQDNPKLQKGLYVAGALLGQGIRRGIGFKGKGGKFKLEDLAMPIVEKIFGKFLGVESGSQEQEALNTLTT